MRKSLIPAAILFTLVLLGLSYGGISLVRRLQNKSPQALQPAIQGASTKEMTIGQIKITIEIADDNEKREKGLSGRKTIPENSGMLFIFEQKDIFPAFWMKGMLAALDLFWINDGRVVKIDKNVPPPNTGVPDSQIVKLYPDQPVDYVLETAAGLADKNNIQVGESVDLSKI